MERIAIFLDKLISKDPIAETTDATSKGMIKDFNIRRNTSPGNCRYMISRLVHFPVEYDLIMQPTTVPPTTASTVRMVRRFFFIIFFADAIVAAFLPPVEKETAVIEKRKVRKF